MKCDCKFYEYPQARIEFCPLHGAAPDLLEALGRAAFHANLRGWSTHEDHELAEVYRQMVAALAKAGGL